LKHVLKRVAEQNKHCNLKFVEISNKYYEKRQIGSKPSGAQTRQSRVEKDRRKEHRGEETESKLSAKSRWELLDKHGTRIVNEIREANSRKNHRRNDIEMTQIQARGTKRKIKQQQKIVKRRKNSLLKSNLSWNRI